MESGKEEMLKEEKGSMWKWRKKGRDKGGRERGKEEGKNRETEEEKEKVGKDGVTGRKLKIKKLFFSFWVEGPCIHYLCLYLPGANDIVDSRDKFLRNDDNNTDFDTLFYQYLRK